MIFCLALPKTSFPMIPKGYHYHAHVFVVKWKCSIYKNIFAIRIHYFCCVTVFFNYRRYVNSISFPKADLFSWVEMQNRWILNILPHEVVIYLILPVHSFFMLMVFFRLDLIYLMLCIPHQTYFCHIFRVNGSRIIFVMENCSSIKRILGVLYYGNHVCVTLKRITLKM